jgi:hypothetical protein
MLRLSTLEAESLAHAQRDEGLPYELLHRQRL